MKRRTKFAITVLLIETIIGLLVCRSIEDVCMVICVYNALWIILLGLDFGCKTFKDWIDADEEL